MTKATSRRQPAAVQSIAGPFAYASVVVVLVVLYAPLAVMAAFSFNDSKRVIAWQGFTLRHYGDVLTDAAMLEALANSLLVAVVATLLAIALGLAAALLIDALRPPLQTLLGTSFNLPMLVPDICLGIALLVFFSRLGWPSGLAWPLSLGKVILAHTTFILPFVMMLLRARLATLDRQQMEAARDLGAGEWRVFVDVTAPALKTALVASGLVAITLSLDDFVVTFFTVDRGTVTLPMKIYSMVRFSLSPKVNAASTLLVLISMSLVTAWVLFSARSAKRTDGTMG